MCETTGSGPGLFLGEGSEEQETMITPIAAAAATSIHCMIRFFLVRS
jgi:hypothetical protein